MAWWTSILGKVPEALATYATRRSEIKLARFEAKLKFEQAKGDRQAQLISQGLAADANWEMEFARQAENSWKDEYTLIVVSIPLIMAWVPGMDDNVMRGFEAFAKTPLWYQVMVQSMFYATVGMRLWRRNQYDTA